MFGDKYKELKDKYVHIETNGNSYIYRGIRSLRIIGKFVDLVDNIIVLQEVQYNKDEEEESVADVSKFGRLIGKKATLDNLCLVELGNVISVREIKLEEIEKTDL